MPPPADNRTTATASTPRSHGRGRRWLLGPRSFLACLTLAAPFAGGVALGQQDTTPPPAGGDTPLARCRVATLKQAPVRNMNGIAGSLLIDNTPTDDPMLDYLPVLEPVGDEPSGDESDSNAEPDSGPTPDSGVVRVLVTSPAATRVIDFRVLIDGASFRDRRRAWLDELVEQGPAQRQLRDAGRTLTNVATAIGEAANLESLSPDSTAPRRRQTPTLRGRLANYLAAVGHEVDRREITALLNQWPSGPAVTVLSPGRSWQRAGVAPLLRRLDADGDAELSAEEVGGAPGRLAAADVDQDGVVQLAELRRGGRRAPRRRGGRLVTVVDAGGAWRRKLARAGLSFATPDRLASGPADLEVTVRFGKEPGVELFAAPGVEAEAIAAGDAALSVDYGAERYEIAALTPSAPSRDQIEQVAVGAAFDGSPLLRLLNTDNDERLTIQEQRRLPELLASLDRDGDGALAAEEVPAPVRIVVGRGAVVHQALASRAAAVQPFRVVGPKVAAPDWFPPMDTNRDGVLTRDEFPGGGGQFKKLDANGDGLVSAAEAAALEE